MEIRDRVREEIANCCRIMREEGKIQRFTPESDADEILSIKIDGDEEGDKDRYELTVVDRKAELPENPIWDVYPVDKLTEALKAKGRGYNEAQQDMAGWIKEVK